MKYSDSSDGMDIREPRAIYVPIFDSFFESSIMHQDLATRFVMLALIRLAHRPRSNGQVDVDARIFAASINIPYEDVERSIMRLMEPDANSGSKLEGGRRIIPLDPERPMRGWKLVNWADYKELLNKANDKIRKANEREEEKHRSATLGQDGQSGQNANVTYDTRLDETKQDEKKQPKRERERFAPPSLAECEAFFKENKLLGDAALFFHHYEAVGWRSGRASLRKWQNAAHGWSKREPGFSNGKGVAETPHITTAAEMAEMGERALAEAAAANSRRRG
jgi:hypothetical protein